MDVYGWRDYNVTVFEGEIFFFSQLRILILIYRLFTTHTITTTKQYLQNFGLDYDSQHTNQDRPHPHIFFYAI